MKKLTPVFVVVQIESCLDFWTGKLDFEKTVEVSEGDNLGFVILTRGNVEIMYQSRESVRKDIPSLAAAVSGAPTPNAIYIEVTDIDDLERRLVGEELVVPRRTTFYGSTEIGVREPAGNLIVFAQPAQGGEAVG